jgi:Domain of unknown function (DUF4350)
MNSRTAWILTLLSFGVFGAAVVYALWVRADAGKGFPDYSVYSEEADGLADAARFLRRTGFEPIAVTRPIQHSHVRGLLVLAEPHGTALFPGERPDLTETTVNSLLHWVEAGNTLLYASRHGSRLHEALEVVVHTDAQASEEDTNTVEVGDGGLYTDQMHRVVVEGKDYFQTSHGLPLWWVDNQPAALVLKHGRGKVILVADPSLFTARGLRREDNGVFLYNVACRDARGDRVYFDEYHHGLRSGGGPWGYLASYREHWILGSLLLVVMVAVWGRAVRLGPAVSRAAEQQTDAVDYASAVARIYQRTGVRRLLARALVRGFLSALTKHLHLRRNAIPAEILRAWREQHPGESGERLQNLLRGVSELRKDELTDQQLLEWTRAFDSFLAEMMRAR